MSITLSFDAAALDSAPSIKIDSEAEALFSGLQQGDPRKLGDLMWMLYRGTNNPEYLDKAIQATQHALELMPHSVDSELLGNFGERLGTRFELTGVPEDLDNAIIVSQRAVALVSDGDPAQPIWLHRLGASLYTRFLRSGSLEDLDISVAMFNRAIELTPREQQFLIPSHLQNYALALEARFKKTKELKDLTGVVEAYRTAVDLTPTDHPERPARIANLGQSLHLRYEHTNNVEDLAAGVTTQELAVSLTPDGDPDKPSQVGALGDMYSDRFQHCDNISDIVACISMRSRAVDLTPTEHERLPERLSLLGNAYVSRYRRLGTLADIKASIVAHRRAIALLPYNHPDLALRSIDLGTALMYCFRRTGELEDMEAGIHMHKQAVALFPEAHPSASLALNNLGSSLIIRLKQLGEIADLEAAIVAHRRALALTPEGHSERPLRLNNLGAAFLERYHRLGELRDIELSAEAHARALKLMPDTEPDKGGCYNNLGLALHNRFEHTRQLADIDTAIWAIRHALALTPQGHTGQPALYSNLSGCLLSRFSRVGELIDLDMAISVMRTANDMVPNVHADKAGILLNLGRVLWKRFERDQTQSNFDAALECFMDTTHEPRGYPSERFDAATLCARLLTRHSHFSTAESLLRAHSRIMHVLPEIVWMGHGLNRRYTESSRLGELVNAAVATAIRAGVLTQAIEWLEAGRSIVWSQILSLRTPLDELAERHPILADSLRTVQQQLQRSRDATSHLPRSDTDMSIDVVVIETAADKHRGLVVEYERLLAQVRTCEGFETFLRPKRLASLVLPPELETGPVVFINVHSSRCDALIVAKNGTASVVALPELTVQRANKLRELWSIHLTNNGVRERAMGSLDRLRESSNVVGMLLERIWIWIVGPILRSLNLESRPDPEGLPHVTWCPTGPIAQLPLHAAGLYSQESGPRTFDLVVSSYTPSLSVLHHCYERISQQDIRHSPSTLVVTQPETPGYASLPGTREEGRQLQKMLSESQITSALFEHERATVAEVQGVFEQHQWVHLACHGSQHASDATQSAFALYDGPLSLANLMHTSVDEAELAFLSACQTATGDVGNPEESVHLAAGMLVVGFKGVIGTMWSIGDTDAPVVVEAYYRKLLEIRSTGEVGAGNTGAAYALHEAMKVLREKIGERNILRWAPFVHFGV